MYRKGNVPNDPAGLPQFLNEELSMVERGFNAPLPYLSLEILNAAPLKLPTDRALLAVADGVNWNPGAGPGLYRYQGGSWTFVG